jgi:hypothetical protein
MCDRHTSHAPLFTSLQYNDICWKGAPNKMEDLGSVFPTMELRFKDGAVLPMKPLQYLFVLAPGAYCLGMFDNGNSGTLIGGITVRNVLVQVREMQPSVGLARLGLTASGPRKPDGRLFSRVPIALDHCL